METAFLFNIRKNDMIDGMGLAKGTKVLVTAGASGIGRTIAETFEQA